MVHSAQHEGRPLLGIHMSVDGFSTCWESHPDLVEQFHSLWLWDLAIKAGDAAEAARFGGGVDAWEQHLLTVIVPMVWAVAETCMGEDGVYRHMENPLAIPSEHVAA